MTLDLFDVVATLLLLGLLLWLIISYQKIDEAQRMQQHEEIMKALLDGAITRAKILSLVERIHDDLTLPPSSSTD